MAKANPFAAIVKKLAALQVKAENLRKEIKDLSIMVMAESRKSAASAPTGKKAVKKTAKKAVRKSARKTVRKAEVKTDAGSLTMFRKKPVAKKKTGVKSRKRS